MKPKRLVLFVEGYADVGGAQVLVERLLKGLQPWDCLFLDPNPFRVAGIQNLTGRKKQEWLKKLQAAGKRGNVGAILLILDGDVARVEGNDFCAATVSRELCERAKAVGAGSLFSVACVFAMKEFESWLIAGIESLSGKQLTGPRPGVRPDPPEPPCDIETHRDAKGWLSKAMVHGYRASVDQQDLASLLDLDRVRSRGLRSFRRLEHALETLTVAVRAGAHVPH